MASQAKAKKAYAFFVQRASQGAPFTLTDLMASTGWKESTARTYITKQWREILERNANGTISVKPEINRFSEEAFLQLATQKRTIYATYDHVKYSEIVTYEFLLPLTREDQLRSALDGLFYEDTIRQRLNEVGLAKLKASFQAEPSEQDDAYASRVCQFVSAKFGGYSITHILGRYRASDLITRAAAGQMIANDTPYLIDETTAAVRFIIPIEAARSASESPFEDVSQPELLPAADVAAETAKIHSLFFFLFVEAVVRTVKGEDEIWLLEDAGQSRSLYIWRRK